MGTIYGVTVTSAIVQNMLLVGLPKTLGDAATEEVSSCVGTLMFCRVSSSFFADAYLQLIEKLRKSLFALRELPPQLETAVRALYCDALRVAFAASSAFALMAFVFSLAQRTGSLQRKLEESSVLREEEDSKDGGP